MATFYNIFRYVGVLKDESCIIAYPVDIRSCVVIWYQIVPCNVGVDFP